ncbi:response regulator [Solirubrobacter ginsenosidimutans]|uniref:histidine kinase n=1 Tax=Solirubrobacter ginsenosidimutans TaxID=490573 RepID=A0A9X3S9C0_9ACTN|nr:response regulator [Solirubrobacter ginsenosidimutans]MDA0164818.1 response regulator [Solirubrobacter ginsenosidimutans]
MSEILVVEDSPTQREQLLFLLQRAGYETIAAPDGAAALDIAHSRHPALVLTDVVMPRMDGYTLCRAIKADPVLHDTPVILLTSLTSPQDVIEGLACGADNFVRKPYESASLLARVQRCLADGVERSRVPAAATVGAEREQVLEFLFSTFEETVHLDDELTRSYQSLDLLYRLAEGLNRSSTQHEVVLEALARALELPGVRGAWMEVEGDRLAGGAGTCSRMTSLDQAPPVDFTVELRSGGGGLGRLQLVGPDERLLDDDELRTLDAFGIQVGAALDRALLQEHLERRVQERTAELSAEVAARQRAEEAVRAMAAIVESADDGMVRLGTDGRIQTWNRGAARMYGYVGDEAVGNSIELVASPDEVDELRSIISRVAWGESVVGHEMVRLTRDGKEIEVSLTLSPVRDADGAVVAIAEIARDITARKELERALLQSQKLDSVGRLAGGIAHDFNNLMTGVIGFSELALPQLDEPQRTFIEEAKRAGERATELTQRLLAFGRRQTLRPKPMDLNTVVAEMETLLARLIGEQIDMALELDPAPCPLVADRSQLEQVVMNLAINARDAMDGRGKLRIATVANDEGHVRLSVTDTGTGMDAETQTKIFEPFFTTKEEGKGTGLGLSTVFGIVHQSGGRIAVDSRLERGTTFTIFLPRGGEALGEADAAQPAETPERGSGSVLVVEDDDSIRALMRAVLEPAGYEVRLAAGGEEALNGADADLLITDILMPGMNGRELATRITERAPETHVLFISGYTGKDTRLQDGERFLAKPFTPSALLEQVQALLTADRS